MILFFELLRYALRIDANSPAIAVADWEKMHQLAKEQCLLGVIYKAVERLPEQHRPPKRLLLQWFVEAEQIRRQNEKVFDACATITGLFEKANIGCCVLKGQGNAVMYDDPFSRMPGDIDLWVDSSKVRIEDGFLIVGNKRLKAGVQVYHHIDIEDVDGVSLEVHTKPSFMNNLFHNKNMQSFFLENAPVQFAHKIEMPQGKGTINVPTPYFNAIYQLAHISKHFFQEGIGLRQFVDYYFVLKSLSPSLSQGGEMSSYMHILKQLGLWKFAGAVMYVMREVFLLENRYMIAPVDGRRGKMLLMEIIRGGNFGKYDEANIKAESHFKKNIQRIKRDIRTFRNFPSESLWEPVFRVYHFFWRLVHR